MRWTLGADEEVTRRVQQGSGIVFSRSTLPGQTKQVDITEEVTCKSEPGNVDLLNTMPLPDSAAA